MLKDSLCIKGAIRAELRKPDGTVKVTEKHNIIVNGGFDFIANAIGSTSARPSVMNIIAVGTGTTSPNATDTKLATQLAYKTVFSFTATFNPGEATGGITEAGVFNGNAGTMLDRVVFAVINKGSEDTLKVTFTFTMA